MDRISRFQTPMHLSSGDFSKPPQIQNEGTGIKSLPPLILDRFRALVKEREEELRVFGGGALLPLRANEIVRLYEIVLSELTINSKPIITDLTIIAGEQRVYGEGIADAICARIIEVPVDQKLPSLYLLDSIVKNIGKEYIKYFSARLPEVFCEAYAQVHPSMHPAMRHLFGTWSSVFPLSVLQTIEAQLQFSPSLNRHSSGLSSSRASESPQPTRGIHINPKYLEVQRQFGHSTVDSVVTEGLSSTGHAELSTSGLGAVKKSLLPAARITKPSSPYHVGHVGSLSPFIDEFGMDDSPNRVAVRASPSHPGINYGLGRALSKDEETDDWQSRKAQGISNQYPKTSATNKYDNGVDLSGPRALISAYGMDERDKDLKRKHQVDSNGSDHNPAIRAWQNTEEEEFDWDDMNPAFPPPVKSIARHNFINNSAAPLGSDFRDLSKAQLSSVRNSSISEDDSFVNPGRGSIPNSGGVLPNLNAEADRTFGRSSDVSALGSTYDSPAFNIRSADDAAAAKPWQLAKFESSHALPSNTLLPLQMQVGGQTGMNNAANVGIDRGLNKTFHGEQYFSSTASMPHVMFPQIPGQHPGMIPINSQSTMQPSQVQPNPLTIQGVRPKFPFPSSVPIPSNAMAPPLGYGYLAQARGPLIGAPSNLIRGVQSPMLIPNASNMPFSAHGGAAHHPLPGGSFPGSALPIGQIAPNPPAGNALSGLFSSLMAQGLISTTNQDSVGVDFDPDDLKVRHESAITALYADLPRQCKTCAHRFKSQEEHSKHMDWHVSRNRTLKNRKTKPAPKWFVSVSMWLTGTEAAGPESVPGFLPAETTVEKEEDEEVAVPADEDQNTCALCGEPFEDFYSDEMEEWMYKGAVYMHASAGSTPGMNRSKLGLIVHAKCRSDSHGISSKDSEKDKGESTIESGRKILQSYV